MPKSAVVNLDDSKTETDKSQLDTSHVEKKRDAKTANKTLNASFKDAPTQWNDEDKEKMFKALRDHGKDLVKVA